MRRAARCIRAMQPSCSPHHTGRSRHPDKSPWRPHHPKGCPEGPMTRPSHLLVFRFKTTLLELRRNSAPLDFLDLHSRPQPTPILMEAILAVCGHAKARMTRGDRICGCMFPSPQGLSWDGGGLDRCAEEDRELIQRGGGTEMLGVVLEETPYNTPALTSTNTRADSFSQAP